MINGWIILHKKIQKCAIWEDKEPFDRRSAWIDLLLIANYEESVILVKDKSVIVGRGQRFMSTLKLADRWHWSVNRVRRYLELLERLQMITTDRTCNGIMITIVNYDDYQKRRTAYDITDEIDDGITHETTRGISHGISGGIQNKEYKEYKEKEEGKEVKNIYGEYRHVRLTQKEHDRLINDFGEEETHEAIKFLDEYKEMKGYKCKNDNLAMRKWVFKAIKEQETRDNRNQPQSLAEKWGLA